MALVCGAVPIPELHNSFQAVGEWLVNVVDEQQMLGEHIRSVAVVVDSEYLATDSYL